MTVRWNYCKVTSELVVLSSTFQALQIGQSYINRENGISLNGIGAKRLDQIKLSLYTYIIIDIARFFVVPDPLFMTRISDLQILSDTLCSSLDI